MTHAMKTLLIGIASGAIKPEELTTQERFEFHEIAMKTIQTQADQADLRIIFLESIARLDGMTIKNLNKQIAELTARIEKLETPQ
jgi:hypothetical protein